MEEKRGAIDSNLDTLCFTLIVISSTAYYFRNSRSQSNAPSGGGSPILQSYLRGIKQYEELIDCKMYASKTKDGC